MKVVKNLVLSTVAGILIIGGLAACEQEGPLERAGERVEESAERAGEKVEKAVD